MIGEYRGFVDYRCNFAILLHSGLNYSSNTILSFLRMMVQLSLAVVVVVQHAALLLGAEAVIIALLTSTVEDRFLFVVTHA